jgi:hypothetical protein
LSADTSIDITDLVEKARSTFVTYGVAVIFAAELTQPDLASVLAIPFLATIDKDALTYILNKLSKDIVMLAFFENTVIKKASQAQDYIAAKNAIDSLPEDTSDEVYAQHEQNEIDTFRNFVLLNS